MQPPYNLYDLQAVDRFSGESESVRFLQIAHCVMLFKQGVDKGLGVFAQKKMIVRRIGSDITEPTTLKRVKQHVALSSYIILDKHILEAMGRQPEWSAGSLARYLESRFGDFDTMKKFYGRSHRL